MIWGSRGGRGRGRGTEEEEVGVGGGPGPGAAREGFCFFWDWLLFLLLLLLLLLLLMPPFITVVVADSKSRALAGPGPTLGGSICVSRGELLPLPLTMVGDMEVSMAAGNRRAIGGCGGSGVVDEEFGEEEVEGKVCNGDAALAAAAAAPPPPPFKASWRSLSIIFRPFLNRRPSGVLPDDTAFTPARESPRDARSMRDTHVSTFETAADSSPVRSKGQAKR